MEKSYCGVCGKEVEGGKENICLGCGEITCGEDYDNVSGYCINCADNCPHCGC